MSGATCHSIVPKAIRFECRLALRHLRAGGGQTLLTISAVAAGVIIVVFITAAMFGLRYRLTGVLTEAIPHVTLQAREEQPTPPAHLSGAPAGLSSSRIVRQASPQKSIDNWIQVADVVRRLQHVRLVAPAVQGQGFASHGGKTAGVSVIGIDPALQDEVAPVSKHLSAGHYRGLQSEEVVIDGTLAADLYVAAGERIRLTSSTGVTDTFTIAGIQGAGHGGDIYVTLHTAQRLFGLGAAVNTMFVKVGDIFAADEVADHLMALLPYDAKSWSREFPRFRTALRTQTAVVSIISTFSLIASAFAIAAIMVVSVLQKSRQIGILKSLGASRRQILRIFLLEGVGVGVVGSVLGAFLGTSLVYCLSLLRQPTTPGSAGPEPLFPVMVLPVYIALAILAAVVSTVLAAVLPARRAASLNPVEVIR
jgi:lipoprotein-releasing system permease protein